MGTQKNPVLSSVLRNVRLGWPNWPDSVLSPFCSFTSWFWCKTVVCSGEAESLYHNQAARKFSMSYMRPTLAFHVWCPSKDVAGIGQRQWRVHLSLPWMSTKTGLISSCSASSLAVAITTMVKTARWLCGSNMCTDNFVGGGCPLKVDQGFSSFLCYNNWEVAAGICTISIPESVVSDNAAYFTSQEFESYLKLNVTRHTKSSPYHLPSNGLSCSRDINILHVSLHKVCWLISMQYK